MNNKGRSIALIGMPGCGKSTIGPLLADKLGYRFVDLDEYIVESTGKSIESLFQQGETTFRDAETKALLEITECAIKDICHTDDKGLNKIEGVVLSTGGGIVIRPENVELLKKHYVIIYLNRSIDEIVSTLDSESRPLLKNNVENIYRLYEKRHALYENCCSLIVDNHGTDALTIVDETINKLKSYL